MAVLAYGNILWSSATDGPGRRVVLYLRGCNLRCPWCHSPHLLNRKGSLLFFENHCQLCGSCEEACEHGVHRISRGRHRLDRSLCTLCGSCVSACPRSYSNRRLAGALVIPASKAEPEYLFKLLQPQLDLFKRIGGLTVCGGEPLLQYRSLMELLKICKRKGMHTAVETSGSVQGHIFTKLADVVDCWLFGLRPVFDASNGSVADLNLVRKNLAYLCGRNENRIIIRFPVIPGMTDSGESLTEIARIMGKHNLSEMELLPWNPHSAHYYRAMGNRYPCSGIRPVGEAKRIKIKRLFEKEGIQVRVIEQ